MEDARRVLGLTIVIAVAPGAHAQPVPEITQQPESQFVRLASNAVFQVAAMGQEPLTYQWRRNNPPSTDWFSVSDDGRISGSQTPVLTISGVQPSDEGNYRVLVYDRQSDLTYSDTVVLTIVYPPSITESPQSLTVYTGDPFSFTAAATGTEPLGYQWRLNGVDVPGETDTTFARNAATTADAGEYVLVVTNVYGAAWSAPALLTVVDSAPVIQSEPVSRRVYAGSDHLLQVSAVGSKPLGYVWLFDGTPLPGATNAALLLPAVDQVNAGTYQVVVSNRLGTVAGTGAVITVQSIVSWGSVTNVPLDLTNIVAISANGHNVALRDDGTVRVWAGSEPSAYNIPPDATNLVSITAGTYHVLGIRADGGQVAWGNNVDGQTSIPPGLGPVALNAAGWYHSFAVRADGTPVHWGDTRYGQAAIPAGLSNVVAAYSADFQTLVAKADGTISIWGASPAGDYPPPADLSNVVDVATGWSHSLAMRRDHTLVMWGGNYFGQLNVPASISNNVVAVAAYRNSSMALLDNGRVVWWGWNQSGPLTVPPGLSNVMAIALGDSCAHVLLGRRAPRVVQQPLGRSVLSGSPALLLVRALGTQPLTYQWLRNGTNIPGANDAALMLNNLENSESGDYAVAISNVLGWTISSNALLSVQSVLVTTQPVPQAVVLGGNVTFNAAVASTSPVGLRWRKDGMDLVDGARVSGSTSLTLSIVNVQIDDAGGYQLVATNSSGSATSAVATLTVLVPPAFVVQPTNQTLMAGSTAILHSLAAGTEPIAYQWYRGTTVLADSTRITGTTNSVLIVSNVVAADAGTYHVVASGPGGTATSQPAVLSVVPPEFVVQPTNQTLIVGSTATLHSLATGVEPITYQWYRGTTALTDNARIVGTSSNTLIISNLQTADAGTYQVVASGPGGTTPSQPAVLSVVLPPAVTVPPANQIVSAGTNVMFSVSAGGTPPFFFQWRFNETPIPGAASSALLLTNVQAGDTGGYDVVVTNAYGAITSAVAVLTVVPSAPTVSVQPQSQVASVGQDVVLNASAWGTFPIVYQWQKDGVDLPGENGANLSLLSVDGTRRGGYRMIASNEVGTATSSTALLSVVPVVVWGRTNDKSGTLPGSATSIVAIAAAQTWGSRSQTLAVRSDGSVASWGQGFEDIVPVEATNIVAIAAGEDARVAAHKLAVRADGKVLAWGSDYLGRTNVPPAASNAIAVAAGEYHSLALRGDGSVIAWGDDSRGQVTVPASATNVVAIAAGVRHSLALRADGTVVGWGWDFFGQVSVFSNATGIVSIAAAGNQSVGLHADGRVMGVVITNVLFNQQSLYGSPPTNLAGVRAIAAGSRNTLYLREDTTISVEGWNTYGEKTPPPYATNVTAIAAGSYHGVALVADPSSPIPPYIGRQPAGRSVVSGDSFVIHSLALGSLPLSRQWWFAGAPVPGQTNAWLYLTNVHPRQAGEYVMVASNRFGSTTSAVATVTVAIRPPAIQAPGVRTNGFRFTFESIAGVLYVTEYKETLSPGLWTELERRFGSGGTEVVTDPNAGAGTRFYRLWAVYTPPPELGMTSFGSDAGLRVPTVIGARYVLEYKDHLEDPVWLDLETRLGTGEVESFVDPGPLPSRRFYRVRVE